MADDPTVENPNPEDDPGTTGPKTYGEDYVKQLRTESGGYRTRLRDAEAALAAAKDEAAAATKATPELTTRAEAAERRALILEVALDKGLPATLVTRVNGTTREEIEADADALVALLAPNETPGPLNYGAGGNTPPEPTPVSASAALHALFKNR